MGKHTPGPWWIWDGTHVFAGGNQRPVGLGERLVANCGGFSTNADDGTVRRENHANAHLVAAAPAMLEALKEAQDLLSYEHNTVEEAEVLDVINAALAAAEPEREADKP